MAGYANTNTPDKLTFQLIITHRKYKLQHPVNPLILDILIQTKIAKFPVKIMYFLIFN